MQELAAAQYRSVEDALMNQEVPKIEVSWKNIIQFCTKSMYLPFQWMGSAGR